MVELSKEKFEKLIGLVCNGCHIDSQMILRKGKGNLYHIEKLPHYPAKSLGYTFSQADKNKIKLVGLSIENDIYNIQICVELRSSKNAPIELVSLKENGHAIELTDYDAVTRTLGKLALQIEYVNSLADQALSGLEKTA